MSFLQDIQPQVRERIALSPGSYGTSREPGLKIMAYIEKASKLDRSGAMRHSFLVAALRPSKEAIAANKNGNGLNPLGTPDYDGTAFLSLTLHELWLTPEATALAFTEATRNKDGVIQADYIAKAIQDGDATEESIDKAVAHFRKIATDKVIEANTPSEELENAAELQYKKELKQIAIKVGQFLQLQDWAGRGRSLQTDPVTLVNAEFSGKVETREFNGKSGSEVTAVWSKSKK